jgi:nitroreductase
MDFFDTVKRRRSIRRFTDENIPSHVIERAFDAAVWAPNSSNAQTWNFYWVKDPAKKSALKKACLSQSAARTAAELIVVTANPRLLRRSQPYLVKWTQDAGAPTPVQMYYQRIIPASYKWGWFNSLGLVKFLGFAIAGLFRPVPRRPAFKSDVYEVAIKSAALAAENFVLAIAAQDFDSCMMEGFDEVRVRKCIGTSCAERVVMVIGIGKAAPRGTWGPPFRIPSELVIHRV